MTQTRRSITAALLAGTGCAMMALSGVTGAAAQAQTEAQQREEAQASEAFDVPLAEERWQELAYGLSLRPWAGARTVEPPPPGMLVQFVGDGFQLRVFIREAGQEQRARQRVADGQRQGGQRRGHGDARAAYPELDIEAVKEWAPRQVAFANPGARVLEEALVEIADRPGARLVYRIDSAHAGDWILGQAFMQIDPYTVARFELNADIERRERALAVFDAVLASVAVIDPRELDEHRSAWIEAGVQWLETLDPAERAAHLVGERWFRVLQDGEDVGYQRVVQEEATDLGLPGIRIAVTEHIHMDGAGFDRLSEYFESMDGRTEVWSTRTARRADEMAGRLPEHMSAARNAAAAETGLRSGQSLDVSTEGPERLDQEQWPELPEAYLSQVNVRLLPALLRRDAQQRDEQQTMALYAYHGDSGRVALRIFTITPLADGGFRLHQRPAPEHREEVATYDAEGELIQRRLADGRVLVPTTREALETIWGDGDGR